MKTCSICNEEVLIDDDIICVDCHIIQSALDQGLDLENLDEFTDWLDDLDGD